MSAINNISRPFLKTFENHVLKSVQNDSYNIKALIMADVVIDSFYNATDYVTINKNKKIPEKERNYLKA